MEKVLITTGATRVPIDQVRVLSNIFRGRTGSRIAEYFAQAGWRVTLLTSSPWLVSEQAQALQGSLEILQFRTFDDLAQMLEREVTSGEYDAVIQSAAVSDYKVEGIYIEGGENGRLAKIDSSDKVASTHPELYLKLVPTIKLIDQIRHPWGFRGKLVKFKLQVGMSDAELIEVSKKSRAVSDADIMVANCLDWMNDRCYIITKKGECVQIRRPDLPHELWRRLL